MSWGDRNDHAGNEEPSGSIRCAKPVKVSPAVWRTESKEEVMMDQCASVRVGMAESGKYDSKCVEGSRRSIYRWRAKDIYEACKPAKAECDLGSERRVCGAIRKITLHRRQAVTTSGVRLRRFLHATWYAHVYVPDCQCEHATN